MELEDSIVPLVKLLLESELGLMIIIEDFFFIDFGITRLL